MEFSSLSLVVICGSSVSADSVRRDLWLPRTPDLRRSLRSVVERGARPGSVAITQHDGYVLVHGQSAVSWQRQWLDTSAAACRVLALRLSERTPINWWSLYEEGRRSRLFDEATGRDLGERRGFEPPRRSDDRPAARMRALYRAMTESTFEADLDHDDEADLWLLDDAAPRRKARSHAAGSGGGGAGGEVS